MPSYLELLKHPNWQKRRLEILNAANFTCYECESTDKTLHVHHKYYEKGKKPWEYPDEALVCVCVDCHANLEGLKTEMNLLIGKLSTANQHDLLGYLSGLVIFDLGDDIPPFTVNSFERCQGLANYFHIDVEFLISRCSGPSLEYSELLKIKDDYFRSIR